MKEYDSIKYGLKEFHSIPIIAFDKLDGSNIRIEWNRKSGFNKVGTRTQLINETSEFYKAFLIFKNKYENTLIDLFKTKVFRNINKITVFGEFFGKQSKFGIHDFKNDIFDYVIFDIYLNDLKCFVSPKDFIKYEFHKPDIIYIGNMNKEFISDIRKNTELKEGVVCKGFDKKGILRYFKLKTDKWFENLRNLNPDLYNKEINEI